MFLKIGQKVLKKIIFPITVSIELKNSHTKLDHFKEFKKVCINSTWKAPLSLWRATGVVELDIMHFISSFRVVLARKYHRFGFL